MFRLAALILTLVFCNDIVVSQRSGKELLKYFEEHYDKQEVLIQMRDGVRLFTSIYSPSNEVNDYPILLKRTPYSCAPYGIENYGLNAIPSAELLEEGYIFVVQDVRGRFMSGGDYNWVRPIIRNKGPKAIDESTDTYDTIEWLIKNLDNVTARVGTWGGSFPGYYVMTGLVDAHPALKCAIPSAPMVDLWQGDDLVHNGAFMMPHNINFLNVFGQPRPKPVKEWPAPMFEYDTESGYDFWLKVGPLKNVNEKLFLGKNIHWEEYIAHPTYDSFWQSRDISQHLDSLKMAVMTIGGWFDAQDLRGPLKAYHAIEERNPNLHNTLVFGPWYHVGWSRGKGNKCADIQWESNTAEFYRSKLELPFYNYYLKGKGEISHIPEILVFDTGKKEWTSFDQWPPERTELKKMYPSMAPRHPSKLLFSSGIKSKVSYTSDPANPVPYTASTTTGFGNDWMVEDQRFLGAHPDTPYLGRPDVLTYSTEILKDELTIAGPVHVHLKASTSGTDADFIVKLIDVFPKSSNDPSTTGKVGKMSGYQMLVRGDPIRAKFRNSLSEPEPMIPNEETLLEFELTDIYHTFKPGHRIMVQIQSSWFPMLDMNPHKFVDLFNDAVEADFQSATNNIHLGDETYLELPVLQKKK